jgi:predicted ferric reductase
MKNKYLYISIFLALLILVTTVPFLYESPSMFYKTGMDKLLLRTGKIIGQIAALLIIFQPFFVANIKFFSRIFSVKKLYKYHRCSGVIILALSIVHPVLILWSNDFVFFSFEMKYWPEFTGIILTTFLIPFIIISTFQKQINLDYKIWRRIHRILAPLLITLMFLHIFNVSTSFEEGVPFYGLVFAGCITMILVIRKNMRNIKHL